MSNHPKNIDGYPVDRLLGQGASGSVYLVRLPGRQRFSALKLFHSGLSAGAELRFKREFKSIVRCRHPGIISVYGIGEYKRRPYYIMEYLKGMDFISAFRQRLRTRSALSETEMRRLIHVSIRILEALRYLHSRRIIHCDLKPANIILTESDEVKLLDFGLAWNFLHGFGETDTGGGTAGYVAPEILRGLPADPRSDLYSLGICIYEVLCGVHPFGTVTDWNQLLERQLQGKFIPPGRLHTHLNAEWDQFIVRMLDPDPTRRFQTAGQAVLGMQRLEPDAGLSPASRSDGASWGLLESEWMGSQDTPRRISAYLQNDYSMPVYVHGAPRSGRSRFLRELSRNIPDRFLKVAINCRIHNTLSAFAGQFISRFPEDERRKSVDAAIREFLDDSDKKDRGVSPKARRARFIAAFQEFAGVPRPAGPVFLFLDRFDSADSITQEMIAGFARLSPEHVRLVLTGDSDAPAPGFETKSIAIPLLDSGQTAEFIRRITGGTAPSPILANILFEWTNGNPGLITDILNRWFRDGSLTSRNEVLLLGPPAANTSTPLEKISENDEIRMPDLLELSLPMTDRLDREILRFIAVYARECPFSILTAAFSAREDNLLEVLDRLVKSEWLRERFTDTQAYYRFCSRYVQDRMLRNISPFHRSYLHRRIRDILSKKEMKIPDKPVFIAEHALDCGNFEVALKNIKEAADLSMDRFDHETAIRLYSKLQDMTAALRENAPRTFIIPPDMAIAFDGKSPTVMDSAVRNTQGVLARQYDELWMKAAKEKGQLYNLIGEYGKAVEAFQRMLARAGDVSSRKYEAYALRFIGQILYYQQKYSESAEHFKKALAVRREIGDVEGVSDCLNALGAVAHQTGDVESALEYFKQALAGIKALKDTRGIAYMRNNIGSIYLQNEDYGNALAEFLASYEILSRIDDKRGMAYTSFNIGETYRGKEMYDQAMKYLNISLEISRSMNDSRGEADCLKYLGETSLSAGDVSAGIAYLRQAANQFDALGCLKDAEACRELMVENGENVPLISQNE